MFFQEPANNELHLCLLPDGFQGRGLLRHQVGFPILVQQRFYISFGNLLHASRQLSHTPSVQRPPEHDLSGYLVTLCYSHLPHIVTESKDLASGSIGYRTGGPHPHRHPPPNLCILPMAGHYFPFNSHAGMNVPMLSIPMSRLVQVHVIHIDGIPGDSHIELGMEMQDRFSIGGQPPNPHFGR